MKLLKKYLFAAFFTLLLVVLFPSDSLAANKVDSVNIDGIEFKQDDVVYFKDSFTAISSLKKMKKRTYSAGYYTFQYKITDDVVAPFKFTTPDGKHFYIKESEVPRDYFLINFYENGGEDKESEKYGKYKNDSGIYSTQIPFYKAQNANLVNVSSLFKYPGKYVNPGMAWLVNSKYSVDVFNQNSQDMSSYMKWGDGPVYIDLYANWQDYVLNKGINDTKYVFVNKIGAYSSVSLKADKENIPDWVNKKDYVWTISNAHSDQGKMRAKGIESKTDKNGNVILKGAKTIEYYVDESCKNGTNIITVTAGDYVQKFKIYTYRWRAHRGYMDKFPENTIEAFIAACEAGAISIETDIQVTKDGEIVCFHDKNMKIMDTSYYWSGDSIPEYNWSDLRMMFFRDSNGLHSEESVRNLEKYNNICAEMGYVTESYQSGQICKFEDFLRICSYYGVYPTVELKIATNKESQWESVWSRESLFKVAELLRRYGFNGQNCVISYYAKTDGGLLAGFSQESGYEFTVYWAKTDTDNNENDDYTRPNWLAQIDPNIVNVRTLSEMLGGDDYRIRSPREGYNVAFGQTGRGWKTFR